MLRVLNFRGQATARLKCLAVERRFFVIIKYTIDRKSLYNGEYENANSKILLGNMNDKITLNTHLPIIYRIANIHRRKENKNE